MDNSKYLLEVDEEVETIRFVSVKQFKPKYVNVNGIYYYEKLSDEQIKLREKELKHAKISQISLYVIMAIFVVVLGVFYK